MDLLSARIQYHQWCTLIKCDTIFTILSYTNNNNIWEASDVQQAFIALYKPNPIFIPCYVSVYQHNPWLHWEHTISTESATIPTSPFPYVKQTNFLATIANINKDLLTNFNSNVTKQDAKFHFDMHQIRCLYDQIYEAMYTPYEETFDKKYEILNGYFIKKLKQLRKNPLKYFNNKKNNWRSW